MQVSENLALRPPPSEDYDFGTGQHGRVGVARRGRGPGDFRLREFVGVYVENVGVVEIRVALGFAGVVVPAEDDDRRPGKGG